MSQDELAHHADTPTWISHLKSGHANPAWGTVIRLSGALGIRVSELAELAEDGEEAPD